MKKLLLLFFLFTFFSWQQVAFAATCQNANIVITGDTSSRVAAGYTKIRVSLDNASYTKPSNTAGFFVASGDNMNNGYAGYNDIEADFLINGPEVVWAETTNTYTTYIIKRVGKFHIEGDDAWTHSNGASSCGFSTDGIEFGQSRMITSQGFKVQAQFATYNVTKPAPASITVNLLPRLTQNNVNLGWNMGAVDISATTPQYIGAISTSSVTPMVSASITVNTNSASVSSQVVSLNAKIGATVIANSGDGFSSVGPTLNIAGVSGGPISCPSLSPATPSNTLQLSTTALDQGGSVNVMTPSGYSSSSTSAFASSGNASVGASSLSGGITSATVTGNGNGNGQITQNTTWNYTDGSGNAAGCNLNPVSVYSSYFYFSMPPLLTSTQQNTGNYLLPVRVENYTNFTAPVTVTFSGAPVGSLLCDADGTNCVSSKVFSFGGSTFKELRLSVPTTTASTHNIYFYATGNGQPAVSKRTDLTISSSVLPTTFTLGGASVTAGSYPGTLVAGTYSNGNTIPYSFSTVSDPNIFCEVSWYHGGLANFSGYLPPGPGAHVTSYSGNAVINVTNGANSVYFKLYCNNSVAGQSNTLWGYINLVPAASVSLSASPSTIKQGDSFSLSWTGTNLASGLPCTLSSTASGNAPSGGQAASNSGISIVPGTVSSVTYTITCNGQSGGTVTANASLTIANINSFGASGALIVSQSGVVNLSYTTSNLLSGNPCTLSRSNPAFSVSPPSLPGPNGSYSYADTVTPINTSPIVYQMTCSYAGGTIVRSASVTPSAAPCINASLVVHKNYGPASQVASYAIRNSPNMLRVKLVSSDPTKPYLISGSPSFSIVSADGVTASFSSITAGPQGPEATFTTTGNVGSFTVRANNFNNTNGATGCGFSSISDSSSIVSQSLSPISLTPITGSFYHGSDPSFMVSVSKASGGNSQWQFFGNVTLNKPSLISNVTGSATGAYYLNGSVNASASVDPLASDIYNYAFECSDVSAATCPNDQTYSSGAMQFTATARDAVANVDILVPDASALSPAFTIYPPADFTLYINGSSAGPNQYVTYNSTVGAYATTINPGFSSCDITRKNLLNQVMDTTNYPLNSSLSSQSTPTKQWSNFTTDSIIEATCTHSSGSFAPKTIQVRLLSAPSNIEVFNKISFDPLVLNNQVQLGCRQVVAVADNPGVGASIQFATDPASGVFASADNVSPVNNKYYKVFSADSNGNIFGFGQNVNIYFRTQAGGIYSQVVSDSASTASNCNFSFNNSDLEIKSIGTNPPKYKGLPNTTNPTICDGKTSELAAGTPYPKVGQLIEVNLYLCNNTSTAINLRNPTSQAVGDDGLADITINLLNLLSERSANDFTLSDFKIYDQANGGVLIPAENITSCTSAMTSLPANESGFCLRIPVNNSDPSIFYPLPASGRFRVEFKGKLVDVAISNSFARWKVDANIEYKKINSTTGSIIPWDNGEIKTKASTGMQIYQKNPIEIKKSEKTPN